MAKTWPYVSGYNSIHCDVLVIHLPGVAVQLGGLSRLVGDAVVNTGTGLWLNAASLTVRYHPRWTHTAGDTPCGHLEKRSNSQSTVISFISAPAEMVLEPHLKAHIIQIFVVDIH